LGFLAKSAVPQGSTYRRTLQEEEEHLRQAPDWVVQQEYLELVNTPLYFHEFNECAASAGLRYVCDAHAASMAPRVLEPEAQQALEGLARDRLELEQYLDFLTNRLYRHSILCHNAREPSYRLEAPQVLDYSVASSAKPVSALPSLGPGLSESFRDRTGTVLTTSSPIVKSALLILGEIWPSTLPFRTLLDAAILRLNAKPDLASREKGGTSLALFLLESFTSSNVVELLYYPPALVTEPSLNPTVTPLARWQARHGSMVTTQRHEPVVLSEAERQTVALLDGSRDRTALVQSLLDLVDRGILSPQKAGQQVAAPEDQRKVVEDTLTQILMQLGRSALLVA
jgi:methyltransferase-like protein